MRELCYIALGSNMNNPREQVIKAIERINTLPETTVVSRSSLYKTKPMDNKPQDDYINAVVAIKTNYTPEQLMQTLLDIETEQGRVRNGERNQSRPLDLDILLYGDLVLQSPLVTVPHYGLTQRAFVLIPLYEIAPTLCLPDSTTIKTYIENISVDGVVRL